MLFWLLLTCLFYLIPFAGIICKSINKYFTDYLDQDFWLALFLLGISSIFVGCAVYFGLDVINHNTGAFTEFTDWTLQLFNFTNNPNFWATDVNFQHFYDEDLKLTELVQNKSIIKAENLNNVNNLQNLEPKDAGNLKKGFETNPDQGDLIAIGMFVVTMFVTLGIQSFF